MSQKRVEYSLVMVNRETGAPLPPSSVSTLVDLSISGSSDFDIICWLWFSQLSPTQKWQATALRFNGTEYPVYRSTFSDVDGMVLTIGSLPAVIAPTLVFP